MIVFKQVKFSIMIVVYIGLHFFKVEENRDSRIIVADYPTFYFGYTNHRQLVASCILSAGRWIMIPTTKEQHISGDFLLRVYSKGWSMKVKYLAKEFPTPLIRGDLFSFPKKSHIRVTITKFTPNNELDIHEDYFCILRLSEDLGIRPQILSTQCKSLVFAIKHFEFAYVSFLVIKYGYGSLPLKELNESISLEIKKNGIATGSLDIEISYYMDSSKSEVCLDLIPRT
jgi:hypothetical protein